MIRALAIQKFSNKFCSSQAQITFYQAFNFVDASVKKDERKTTNNVQRIRIIWLDLDRFCLDSDPCTCAVRIRIRRQFFNFFNIHILIIEPNPSEQNFVTGKIRIRNTDRRGSGSEGPPSLAVLWSRSILARLQLQLQPCCPQFVAGKFFLKISLLNLPGLVFSKKGTMGALCFALPVLYTKRQINFTVVLAFEL